MLQVIISVLWKTPELTSRAGLPKEVSMLCAHLFQPWTAEQGHEELPRSAETCSPPLQLQNWGGTADLWGCKRRVCESSRAVESTQEIPGLNVFQCSSLTGHRINRNKKIPFLPKTAVFTKRLPSSVSRQDAGSAQLWTTLGVECLIAVAALGGAISLSYLLL